MATPPTNKTKTSHPTHPFQDLKNNTNLIQSYLDSISHFILNHEKCTNNDLLGIKELDEKLLIVKNSSIFRGEMNFEFETISIADSNT